MNDNLLKGIRNGLLITAILCAAGMLGAGIAYGAVCSGDPGDPDTVCCTYVIGAHHCYWDCDNGEQYPAPCPRPQSTEVYAGAECPANPNDPIGQLLCGETDCVRDSAWTGRSCRAQQEYWCCSSTVPKKKDDEAVRGFTLQLVDANGLPVSADAESVAVSWRVIRTTTKGGLTLQDVVQSGVGVYENGRLTTERGAVEMDPQGACEPR